MPNETWPKQSVQEEGHGQMMLPSSMVFFGKPFQQRSFSLIEDGKVICCSDSAAKTPHWSSISTTLSHYAFGMNHFSQITSLLEAM